MEEIKPRIGEFVEPILFDDLKEGDRYTTEPKPKIRVRSQKAMAHRRGELVFRYTRVEAVGMDTTEAGDIRATLIPH